MATKKKAADKAPEVKPNREQRRAEKFGRHRPTAGGGAPDQPWPETQPNPAFGRGGDDQAAYTGRADQDVTRLTGPGTGGATEEEGQRPHHEGTHAGQSTKG